MTITELREKINAMARVKLTELPTPFHEIKRLSRVLEGIFLYPIYTGKAMAALADHIKKGRLSRDDTVVFLHTGGNAVLFAYTNELSALNLEQNLQIN